MTGFVERFITGCKNMLLWRVETFLGNGGQNGNGHRSEHAGLHQPVSSHREHRAVVPRCRGTGCGNPACVDHPVDPRSDSRTARCSTRIRRGDHEDDHKVTKPAQLPGLSRLSLLIVLLLAALMLLTCAANATTISFSPLNLGEETLLVHNSTGYLIGVYNTSSKGIFFDNDTSYSILVQPQDSNLLSNHPDTWFANVLSYIQFHAISIIVMVFIVSMLILAIRRR